MGPPGPPIGPCRASSRGPRRVTPDRPKETDMAQGDEPEVPDGEAAGAGEGPLAGVRVLDLTSVVMGPMATQILGDLGAEVISVESGRGETNRIMGPGSHPQLSGIALNLLRNKRNVAIDLKAPEGRAAVLRIAA